MYLYHVAASLLTPEILIILIVNDLVSELINVNYLNSRIVIFTCTLRTCGLTTSSTSCAKKGSE